MTATVEVPKGRVIREDGGVIAVRWSAGVDVDITDIEGVLDAELSLLQEARGRVLVDSRPVRSMTRAAQRRTAEHEIAAHTAAVAILIDGPVSRMLGNFFLSVSRPAYPTRLFADEASALAWLETFRE